MDELAIANAVHYRNQGNQYLLPGINSYAGCIPFLRAPSRSETQGHREIAVIAHVVLGCIQGRIVKNIVSSTSLIMRGPRRERHRRVGLLFIDREPRLPNVA